MKRHPVDLLSFVSGLLALAVGLVLLSGSLDQVPMEWVGPVAAIGLGVVIAVAARPRPGPQDETMPDFRLALSYSPSSSRRAPSTSTSIRSLGRPAARFMRIRSSTAATSTSTPPRSVRVAERARSA